MSIYTKEDICRLQHCIYLTFLHNPRLYYDEGAKRCEVVRNTFTKYWKEGLKNEVFFPLQIRLKMYKTRKEYIYLVQNDTPNKLYKFYKNHPDVLYLTYAMGNFNLLIMTTKPLDELPEKTLLYGSRGDYQYPETPYSSFEKALEKMESISKQEHSPFKSVTEYPDEPVIKGAAYGWRIFPYVKYDMRTNYTFIVKKLGLSFSTFYKGYEYLLNISTILLPYYPFGLSKYSQHFFVFWTDYEGLIHKIFSYIPSHVSITKVGDALLVYAAIEEGKGLREEFFNLFYQLVDTGYITRLWEAFPVHHYRPDPP